MGRRSDDYLCGRDIDWFFKANGGFYHCASNGGLLPNEYREISLINNIKEAVMNRPPLFSPEELYYNEEYIESVVNRQIEIWSRLDGEILVPDLENYIRTLFLSSFIFMAQRGFVSLDRVAKIQKEDSDKIESEEYIMIARPLEPVNNLLLILGEEEINLPDLSDLVNTIENNHVTIRI